MRALETIAVYIAALCLPVAAQAQIENLPSPPADPRAIPLYDAKVGSAADEIWTKVGPMTSLRNVTRPTLTPYLPDPAKATGAAVVIAPGGGNIMLATEMEGSKVAQDFVDRGIAAFVLKYRLTPTPREIPQLRAYFHELQAKNARGEDGLGNPAAVLDGLAAIKLVRANAAKWNVDPKRVGVIGYSSGAEVSRGTAISADAAGRPDFAILLYGASGAVEVPATAPPMFYAVANDDTVIRPVAYPVVESWLRAKRPVEMHAYQSGGHGFTQGKASTSALHMEQVIAWLRMQNFLGAKSEPQGQNR